jgi:hypothetical protein
MRKILIPLAMAMSLVAANAEAHGGSSHGYYHGSGHYHGTNSAYFFYGALGAALTLPFFYSWASANPGPYYYYSGPTVYAPGPPVYVQGPPAYVQSQPGYSVAAAQPGNGVIELGPVNAQPRLNADAGPSRDEGLVAQTYAYPSKGQSPQQQVNDRIECNKWAVNESGYDPDLRSHRHPESGPAAYARAFSACLEGRGYTVR